jgi:hypothetical protein
MPMTEDATDVTDAQPRGHKIDTAKFALARGC